MDNVIFIPGLGDYNTRIDYLVKLWTKENITMHVHLAPWEKKEENLEKKIASLIKKIDAVSKSGKKVSLLGTSAAGSLIINAYFQRKAKIHKLITVSARLLKGERVFPSLSLASHGYPAFQESVLQCEALLPKLTLPDKAKILTTQSLFFDEMVPLSTTCIPGVKRLKVAAPFHIYSIGAALTLYRNYLITFLKQP